VQALCCVRLFTRQDTDQGNPETPRVSDAPRPTGAEPLKAGQGAWLYASDARRPTGAEPLEAGKGA